MTSTINFHTVFHLKVGGQYSIITRHTQMETFEIFISVCLCITYTEYVSIYRSILNMIYWPIYESGILTDIWFFPKMIYWSIYVQIFHFLSDICKFLFSKFMHISVEISYKILIFSYIGQYNIISADIWLHIPIIYVFIYRAL